MCQISTEFECSGQIFIKDVSIKFHGNLSSGSSADICGRTDGDGRTNKRMDEHNKVHRHFLRLCKRA